MSTRSKGLSRDGRRRPRSFFALSPLRLTTALAMALAFGSAQGDAACPLPALDPPFAQGALRLDRSTSLQVDIARTPEQRKRGLMCSPPLAPHRGMLLSYPASRELAIWMKNMGFALDILFLDEAGRILSIRHSVPPCSTDPCPVYRSAQRARHALELPAGRARELGLAPGRRLNLPAGD